jgi:hypothetical protein
MNESTISDEDQMELLNISKNIERLPTHFALMRPGHVPIYKENFKRVSEEN